MIDSVINNNGSNNKQNEIVGYENKEH